MKSRVVSLVPSWTETLIECGAEVVGRTRFCIHPDDAVRDVPTVGGTKDPRIGKIREINPDFVIVDREENTREFVEACPVPVIDTWVRSISDCARDCRELAESLRLPLLGKVAERWSRIDDLQAPELDRPLPPDEALSAVPFLVRWLRPPTDRIDRVIYLIWDDPWMTVGQETFIGSVLEKVGLGPFQFPVAGPSDPTEQDAPSTYPTVDLSDYDPASTILLGSSEPFPFHKKPSVLLDTPFPVAIVDGENYSWFGVRTLAALESLFP